MHLLPRILSGLCCLSLLVGAQEVAFVTMERGSKLVVREGAARAARRLAPCSTFKIPNALVGLESGVIPSPTHILKYDDKKHRTQKFWPEAWQKDQDLRTAFRASAVWYFREIADRTGPQRMQGFLERFDYGNKDATGWSDPFWIGSTLRISPVEQVEFLDRLFRNQSGVKPANLAALEDFMRQEEKAGRVLHYKTGACTDRDAGPLVWLVGFVDQGARRTYFAMNAGDKTWDSIFDRRIEIGKEALRRAGLWE